jgi:transposase
MVAADEARYSREALYMRLMCASAAEFMRACVHYLMKEVAGILPPLDSSLLKSFSMVVIADSSSWDVNPALRDAFRGFGGCASAANCKIQVSYEYNRGELNFHELTEGTCTDGKYSAELPDVVEKGGILIVDLGYFSLQLFTGLIEKGAFFLTRLKVNATLRDANSGEKLKPLDYAKSIKEDIHEKQVIIGSPKDGENKICRMIIIKAPKDVVKQRRKRLKRESQKRGNSDASKLQLEMCQWTITLTNANEEILPKEKVLNLYSARWQIELIFKQLKSVIGINKVKTKNENYLKCVIYGGIIAAILIHQIHAYHNIELWNTRKRELSFEKLYKRIQERAFTLLKHFLKSVTRAINYLRKEVRYLVPGCMKIKQQSRKTTLEQLNF